LRSEGFILTCLPGLRPLTPTLSLGRKHSFGSTRTDGTPHERCLFRGVVAWSGREGHIANDSREMAFFQQIKDRLIEKTAPSVLNETVFRDYGEITRLEVDSHDKSIHFEALLRGEKELIRVEILCYEIVKRDGRFFFVTTDIRTSREWVKTL